MLPVTYLAHEIVSSHPVPVPHLYADAACLSFTFGKVKFERLIPVRVAASLYFL